MTTRESAVAETLAAHCEFEWHEGGDHDYWRCHCGAELNPMEGDWDASDVDVDHLWRAHVAAAVLTALDSAPQPALGDNERAALTEKEWEALLDSWSCDYCEPEKRGLRGEFEAILAARAHQPTPPAQAEAVAAGNWPQCRQPQTGKCFAWCKCRCHVRRAESGLRVTQSDIDQWVEGAITQGEQVGNYIYLTLRAALDQETGQ